MKRPKRIVIAYKALRELGLNQVGLNALYRLGVSSAHYQRQLSRALARLEQLKSPTNFTIHPCLPRLPGREDLHTVLGEAVNDLYQQADEIVSGQVRLFGGAPVPLNFTYTGHLKYWTAYEGRSNNGGDQDIKIIWEPARFGWAVTLARAYYLSGNEKYAESFWRYTEQFFLANPPYLGPQWTSAQEVAIRLVSIAFAYQVFIESNQTTPDRTDALGRAIAIHAERIPPTLVYARSQNNNHLFTEALALYTASALLSGHPYSQKWHNLGWKWLQIALRTQISPDGEYIQHSTNYHRLMLQSALWMFVVNESVFSIEQIPNDIKHALGRATSWLLKLVDPVTGKVPNLGHNDGAHIFPLTQCPISDYRPVLAACMQSFLNQKFVPGGPWEEMQQWLPIEKRYSLVELSDATEAITVNGDLLPAPLVILSSNHKSWAYFRVARYRSRPAHADHLHVDLWWHGLNIALDPGTYLYNALPPWDNSLTQACVHNTVTIDNLDFMLRASRFLYLDWAQGCLVDDQVTADGTYTSITAKHDGYQKIQVSHMRKVSACDDGHWEIIDRLEGPHNTNHIARLHWLVPDWEYEVEELEEQTLSCGYRIRFKSPFGWITLVIRWSSLVPDDHDGRKPDLILARAGERILGSGEISPINGWVSPTYGEKVPALSCVFEVAHALPIELTSEWTLPNES